MKKSRLAALAATLLLSAFALTGCMGDDQSEATPNAADTTSMSGDGMNSMNAVSISSPASDLRITLDRLLGEHALLAMLATQKGFSGDKDFKPIAGALDRNSVDLSQAIGSVYGDAAREEFLNGDLKWRPHIGFFVDYTVGLAKKDKAMQRKAVGNLKGYIESFSSFMAEATDLPQPALRSAITSHVNQLKGQIDAYSTGQYPVAYAKLHQGYHHMFMTGDTLAGGISKQFPQKFRQGNATMAASDLRVALGRMLGEHSILAIAATQKGFSGDKDFKPAAAALDRNSVELSRAIGSVYGDAARKEFLDGKLKWRAHIGFFVDYTVGLAKKDKAMQRKAVGNLNGYIESFSAFLAKATGLPVADVRMSITEHVGHLKGQIDAYAAGDYAKAYSLTRTAYEHMYMTGDALAGAIVKQSPEKFAA